MSSSKKQDNFYRATLNRMVNEGLLEKHEAWAQAHKDDSDAELAEYLRVSSRILKHTPHEGEIWGSPLITERFGTWENAIIFAGLKPNECRRKQSKFRIVIEETAYQTEHYQENRRKKKADKAEKIRLAREMKAANDAAWQIKQTAEAHEGKQQELSDEVPSRQ